MAKGELEVNITATDKASDKLDEVAKKVQRVGDEEGEVVIKAEIKAAQADLRRLQRELRNADGEEAEVKILADIARAKSDIAALDGQLADLDATVAEPKVEAPDAGGAGFDAGELFGLNAIKGMGAAGLAAAIATLFQQGLDRIKLRSDFQSRFGLVKADAERFGREAGEVYSDGWGESVDQVLTAIGTIDQALVNTGLATEAEGQAMQDDFLAVADVLGIDVTEAIRLVQLMMANDLAPSASAALDLIVAGFQDGGNAAGDLTESIEEYAQHYGALGLSGADMMAQFVHGMANGQRDTDKLADAVKEFRIRAVEDTDAVDEAYADLGLSADDYRAKIAAGGPEARTAFIEILSAIDSVQDPIEKQEIAIALMGTQYEDLGPKALDSLLAIKDGTFDATGATEELVESADKATSAFETLKRSAIENITGATEAISGFLNQTVGKLQENTPIWNTALDVAGLSLFKKEADDAADSVDDLGSKVYGTSQNLIDLSVEQAVAEKATDDAARATEEAADAADEHAEALEEERDELEANAEALLDEAEALEESVSAKRAAADSTFALRDAEDDLIDTIEESTKVIDDSEASARDKQQAVDDVAQSAAKLADAEVRLAEDIAAQTGATLTATEKLDIQNASMLAQAASASGPLRDGILDYIESVNDIPESTMTDIQAAIDRGDLAEAERLINETSRSRRSTITADAHTRQANADLDAVARQRTANIVARYTGQGQRLFAGQSHTGSRFAAGETKIVVPGQVFTPDVGGRMSSVEESRRMVSGAASSSSGGGTPVHITLMDGRTVKGMFDERDAELLRALEGGLR